MLERDRKPWKLNVNQNITRTNSTFCRFKLERTEKSGVKKTLTAALVRRNTDSLLAKWRSGSIFIILRILVWGNCVSLVRWSSSWIAGFSSICEPTSVISVRDSTVSAILNMKLAGKVGWFQSTRSWKEACRRALRRRAKGRTNQVHGWSTTKSFNLFHNFRSKCVLLSELYNSVYESWVWPECNCDRKIIHHSNSELNWHVSFNLK